MQPLSDVFSPNGLLSQHIQGYTFRQEQMDAATVMDEAFGNSQGAIPRIAIVEAGTGTGKSLAYLVAAARAIRRGKVVVISTHTIGLQEQLASKDVPLLMDMFPDYGIRPAVLKGRNNYLCKLDVDAMQGDIFMSENDQFQSLVKWARTTRTGDKSDFDAQYPNWNEVACKLETCRGQECFLFDQCFYFRARAAAKVANLVIVNHALTISDLMVKEENADAGVLPKYDALILDEAHHIEAVATQAFSLAIDSKAVPNICRRLRRAHVPGFDHGAIDRAEAASMALFDTIRHPDMLKKGEMTFEDALVDQGATECVAHMMCDALQDLYDKIAVVLPEIDDKTAGVVGGSADSALKCKESLENIFFSPEDDCIRYIRADGYDRKSETLSIFHTPVECGKRLYDMLWSSLESGVLTSATLSNSGRFSFLRRALGLPKECMEQVVGSPFDYKKQVMLYVPGHLGEPPKSPTAEYMDATADEIERILALSGGRAFCLFTNRTVMHGVHERLIWRLPFPVMKQGEKPVQHLIDDFKAAGNAVLFGVSTFWEGVDVQGDALSCVIIDRVPFFVPDSPLNKAKSERVTARGGNPFAELAIPTAQLRLRQGFGRLIRTSTDRGVVAILDSRLVTKPWGRQIVGDLPPASRASKRWGLENFCNPQSVLAL